MTDETLTDNLLYQPFDEYRLDALLGQGGMARVYRGFDVRLKRWAAVKIIDTPFRSDPNYAARFEREAQAIAQLKHPHIVGVYRYGEVDGLLYIAMEYIEGSDLESYLAAHQSGHNTLAPAEISRIIRQVCLALDYAHAKGVIHRDIKPSNIMLDENGAAILTDFGLALLDTHETRGEIFGTPYYVSPEQVVSSAGAVPQSDLYAVGVILYEMFTAKLPFQATHPHDVAMLHLTEPPPPPRTIQPAVSPEVEAIILKALAKEPQDRFPSGAALADALDQALLASTVDSPTPIILSPILAGKSVGLSIQDQSEDQAAIGAALEPARSGERLEPQDQPAKEGKLMRPRYLLKNITTLLAEITESFSEAELRQLCLDIPDFKPVHRQLSQNLGKAEIVQRLLEYAEQTLQLDELLELAKARNLAIYEKYKPYYEYLSSGSRDLMGKNLGKYHIIERLGQGGMADVYKAYQSGLARYVAIKIIHSHLADNEEFMERFESEAMAVASLRHPNIVQVFDFDREDERYYMVMEFIAGHTLETELKNRKVEGQLFPLNEIVDIFNPLASAIDYAHSRGVIHRDLKPGNIMFTSRRRIVLTDFGIARITSIPSYTMTSAVIGTPAYMAPEQAIGQGVDERSDIYSLGVILYELATGRIPFEGDNPLVIMMNLMNGAYSAPRTINPELPEAIEQVILRAMSKSPDDRYQGAGELAQALQAAVEMAGNTGLLTQRVDTSAFKGMDQSASIQARDKRPNQAKDQALQKAAWPEIEIPSTPPRQIDDTGRQPEKRGKVITISGNSGQVVIDSAHNAQVGDIHGEQVSVGPGLLQASLLPETRETSQTVLQRMLTDLKARLEIEAPAEKKGAALERLIELEEAITAARPDLDTISYVKNWFGKHIPNLAGALANLISHPLVEQLYRGY